MAIIAAMIDPRSDSPLPRLSRTLPPPPPPPPPPSTAMISRPGLLPRRFGGLIDRSRLLADRSRRRWGVLLLPPLDDRPEVLMMTSSAPVSPE
jgi:hypothetical protein